MYARSTAALTTNINNLKTDIEDILQSGNYYCNEEIARELSAINNGLEHIKLDNAFLSTSNAWQSNSGLDANQTANPTGVIQKAAAYLNDYRNQMNGSKVQEKQENQVRELHQWAILNLKDIQREMWPFTYGAANRINQFNDHIGVTDRYTGYRNNLTRGNLSQEAATGCAGFINGLTRSHTTIGSPTRERSKTFGVTFGEVADQQYGMMGNKVNYGSARPPMRHTRGFRTIDSLYPWSTTMIDDRGPSFSHSLHDVKTMNTFNAKALASCQQNGHDNSRFQASMMKSPTSLSVQEQAGINTTFPGDTEYMSRFTQPPIDIPTSHFTINPKPDFLQYGRPLGKTHHYAPSFTEYQSRYEWPNGQRIVKLPWLRK